MYFFINCYETLPDCILTHSASFKNKKHCYHVTLFCKCHQYITSLFSQNWRKNIFSHKKVFLGQMSLVTIVHEYARLSKK